MVKNPRKKTGPSRIRPLNRPEPVEVEEGDDHRPAAIISRGRRAGVASVEDVWDIVDEWWRANPIARRYYRVVLEDGPSITLFQDLMDGRWYEQRG